MCLSKGAVTDDTTILTEKGLDLTLTLKFQKGNKSNDISKTSKEEWNGVLII